MKTRLLITVKTYPVLSKQYNELVCTAGFREDGAFVRLYPVPFRKLDYDKRYKKYQWIELDIVRNDTDFRPESYRPVDADNIKVVGEIGADGGSWSARREIVLRKVYRNLEQLIDEAKNREIGTSLAVFKPSKIIGFSYKETEREWDMAKLESFDQLEFFFNKKNRFKVVQKIPYAFSYTFLDDAGKESTMMVSDWEAGKLYLNCLARHRGDEERACADVCKKYYSDFALTKDLFFFLGTAKSRHFQAKNPFSIIGTFHPGFEQNLLFRP
ncbi:MAG TPA: hypothetical protein ENN21_11185 [Spirochaetes bacterium]|nr:hypothetical protein [Spirochaetota bacterium]